MEVAMFPLTELLQDAGLSSVQVCDKVLSKATALLAIERSAEGTENATRKDIFPHDLMVAYLDSLSSSLQQCVAMKELEKISTSAVKDIFLPYFSILSKQHTLQASKPQAVTNGFRAVVCLLGNLLKQTKSCKECVVDSFSLLVNNIHDVSSEADTVTDDSELTLNLLSQVLRTVSVDTLEQSGLDLSRFFENLLELLKVSETNKCFLLASSVLPHFVTLPCAERAETIWFFISSVHSGKINVECSQSELVLTLLCCFRDVFIFHDKSSPFSSLFPHSVIARGIPLLDLRNSSTFWCVVQEGLVNPDPFARKRCSYLLHCVLMSVQSSLDCSTVCCEDRVFWWAEERASELKAVWDDLVLILETMEENQIHIVKPVKKYFSNVVNATRETDHGHSLLHISWLEVALSRIFDHHEARSIIRWGVLECLGMELNGSPLIHEQHWDFVCSRLLQVLGQSFLYNRGQGSSLDPYPPVAQELTVFLQNFVSELSMEKRGEFLTRFLSSCAEMKLAEVPLVFISFAFSQLSPMPAIGHKALSVVRSIVLSCILTHKPSLRAASQTFLLSGVCRLTDLDNVNYFEIIQTLGCFRVVECLSVGSTAWDQASKFLVDYSFARTSSATGESLVETKSESFRVPDTTPVTTDLYHYLQCCIGASVGVTTGGNDPLPSPHSLARALLLSLHRECTSFDRILSSQSRSLDEALSCLLAPVMDMITTASIRVYLAQDYLQNALQLLLSILQMVVGQDTANRGLINNTTTVLYKFLLPWLPECVLYVYDQLLQDTKETATPDLEHTLFYLRMFELLQTFLLHFEFPFESHAGTGLNSLACKASEVLIKLGSDKGQVKLTSAVLGSLTALGWISSFVSSSLYPLTKHSPQIQHQLLVSTVVTAIESLPLPLHFSKPSSLDLEERAVAETSLIACRRGIEWGPLVSHCYSSYWKCMLFVLKHDVQFSLAQIDHDSLVHICLEGLDQAIDSIATIVHCLSQLLTKGNPNGSSEALAMVAEPVWSMLMEQKNNHRVFYEALDAFSSLLFHPKLLWETDPVIIELQQMYAEKYFSLGEARTGICNILINHVCSIWKEGLRCASSVPRDEVEESRNGCQTLVDVFASLSAHKQLLLQACTFGTVHKKNIRILQDTEEFIESVRQSMSSTSNAQGRHLDSNSNARVKILTFLMEITCTYGSEPGDEEIQDVFGGFLHDFVCVLVREVIQMSNDKPKYYINSQTHRVKLRLLQTIIITLKHTGKVTCTFIAEQLLPALQYDNQLSVRYLIEWINILVLNRYPQLMKTLFQPYMKMDSDNRLSRLCSIFTIAMHVGANMNSVSEKAAFYLDVFPAIFQWTTSHHFTARLYAQHTVFRMWEDCKSSKVMDVIDKFSVLDNCISFMRRNGIMANSDLDSSFSGVSEDESHSTSPSPLSKRNKRLPLRYREDNGSGSQLPQHVLQKTVTVVCNQTGKQMNVKAASLTNLSGEMSIEDLKVGSQLQYEGKGNKTFAVTFIEPPARVKKRGGKSNKKENMPPQKQAEPVPSKQTEGLLQHAKNEFAEPPTKKQKVVVTKAPDDDLISDTYTVHDIEEDRGTEEREPSLKDVMDRLDSFEKSMRKMFKKLQGGGSIKLESGLLEPEDDEKFQHNGNSLLRVRGNTADGYARNLLDTLFTKEEQKKSLLYKSSKSKKPSLDEDRVAKLMACIERKFPGCCMKTVEKSVNQKCRDAKPIVID